MARPRDDDYEGESLKSHGKLLIVAIGIVLGIVGLAAIIGLAYVRHSAIRNTAGKPIEDPYPECRIIREWLKENRGDVEIVSWGNLNVSDRTAKSQGRASMFVTFRDKGKEKMLEGHFAIGPNGVVVSSWIRE